MPSNKKNKFAFYLDLIIKNGGRQYSTRYHYGTYMERERSIQRWKNESEIIDISGEIANVDELIALIERNQKNEPRFLKAEERFLAFLRLAKKGGFTPYYRRVN